jgi:vacuolar-type H+-ATPase subunit H
MGEVLKDGFNSGLGELEKTFLEYKTKLQNAEQEAQEIVDFAWKKAEVIIAGQQDEAKKTIDKERAAASEEAARMISEARNRAAEIEKEAENKAKKEARDRTKREVEKLIAESRKMAEKQSSEIIERAKKESEVLIKEAAETNKIKLFDETEAIITEAKKKAREIYEESLNRVDETNRLISEITHKADDIVRQFKTNLQSELANLVVTLDKTKSDIEASKLMIHEELNEEENISINNDANKRKELVILQPYSEMQIQALKEIMKRIPGIKIEGNAATENTCSIFLNVVKPIPLTNMLLQLSMVESANVKGEQIKLKLKDGNSTAEVTKKALEAFSF